jgi:hypothetical protein
MPIRPYDIVVEDRYQMWKPGSIKIETQLLCLIPLSFLKINLEILIQYRTTIPNNNRILLLA